MPILQIPVLLKCISFIRRLFFFSEQKWVEFDVSYSLFFFKLLGKQAAASVQRTENTNN